MVSFIFGGNTNETPESLKRKREMIEALIVGQRPPQNWGEGWGAVMKGITAGVLRKRADDAEAAGRASGNSTFDKITSMLTGGVSPSSGAQSTSGNIPMTGAAGEVAGTTPGGGSANYRDAIASIESAGSGDYSAVGPRHPKLGRALGRYQVMESNIGPWSRAALGREVTPDEFMADPKLQDAIFDHQFQQYVDKYGPEGAAQAWFGGEGGVGKTNRKDSLGTSIGGYGKKFMKALGPGGGGEVAAATPEAAFGAVMPELGGGIPANADPIMRQNMMMPSLSDEVSAYQQTPEYRAQFPGMDQQRQVTDAIPQEFQNSRQVMGAQGGMMPTLMGGDPATADQVAQARTRGQQTMTDAGGPSLQQLYEAAANPWLSQEQKAIVAQLLDQKLQEQDPLRQMQLEKGRIELDQLRNPRPSYDFITGRDGAIFRTDGRGGLEQVYGGKPETFRVLSDDEKTRYGLDPAQSYQIGADNKISTITGNGTTVNIDQKAEGAFDKKLAEKQAETFDTMANEGLNARADLGIINELDALLQGQGGTLSGLAGVAAKYGIGGEGVDDLQAAQALINKLVPTQRQPGSGSMSDRDVELFTRSLPSLWNTPGGNQKIISVMRGLAEYRQAQGEIADQVLMGEMSRQEARRALRELPNPLADVRAEGKGDRGGGSPIEQARDAIKRGASREAVIQRLIENGIDPEGL